MCSILFFNSLNKVLCTMYIINGFKKLKKTHQVGEKNQYYFINTRLYHVHKIITLCLVRPASKTTLGMV
jgi:hypothetical protein